MGVLTIPSGGWACHCCSHGQNKKISELRSDVNLSNLDCFDAIHRIRKI
jgi:hypothetical protein